MRQQITFQGSQQQFDSTDNKQQFQSNSSNAHGTSRFGEQIRSKQMTFQNDQLQSQTQSQYQYNQDNSQPQRNTNEILQKSMDSNSKEPAKRASAHYFQNLKQSKDQSFSSFSDSKQVCQQHGLQGKMVCVTVGCQDGWLCDKCEHDCVNIMEVDQFKNEIQRKVSNQPLEVIQNEKFKVNAQIKEFFNALKQDLMAEIDEIETKFITRIFNETNSQNELSSQFMRELFELNLLTLNNIQEVTQLSKLLINDYFKITDLGKVFVDDKMRFQKKFKKYQGQVQDIFLNFVDYCNSYLQDDLTDYTQSQLSLLESKTTQYHQNKSISHQISNFKPIQSIKAHSGKQIVDLCCISNHMIASASNNGEIIIWKLPHFNQICHFQHGIECTSLAVCQDQWKTSFLLSAGKDNSEYQIYLWNIDLRYKVGDVIGHTKQLRKIVPLPNSQIAWCQEDSTIRIWKLSEKVQVHELNFHSAWINDVCKISKTSLASCSRDYTVAVIDFITGQAKYIIKDVSYVNCISAICQDLFCFANYNGQIKIYQTESPTLILQIQVSNNWMDSNCIWYIIRISNEILAVSNANGDITFLKIEGKKEQIIRVLQNNQKVSEAIMWIPSYKFFLNTSGNEIKVLQ